MTYSQLLYIQALVYSEPEEYGGPFSTEPCVTTGIFRTRGIFRTLSNIYYEEFYSEPCITLAYLKLWHIQNPRDIPNTVKHLS